MFGLWLWTKNTRRFFARFKDKPRLQKALALTGVLLTFHYVALGWVWFALPDLQLGGRVFLGLFGL